jgi:hypothetical protein
MGEKQVCPPQNPMINDSTCHGVKQIAKAPSIIVIVLSALSALFSVLPPDDIVDARHLFSGAATGELSSPDRVPRRRNRDRADDDEPIIRRWKAAAAAARKNRLRFVTMELAIERPSVTRSSSSSSSSAFRAPFVFRRHCFSLHELNWFRRR